MVVVLAVLSPFVDLSLRLLANRHHHFAQRFVVAIGQCTENFWSL